MTTLMFKSPVVDYSIGYPTTVSIKIISIIIISIIIIINSYHS